MSCADVLERVERAGPPGLSLIVQTPSGGFYVYFYFEHAKRTFPATLGFYKRIQQEIAMSIGRDPCVIGAERWFRISTSDYVIYESTNRVNF